MASKTTDHELLERILRRLEEISPRVLKLPVEDVTDGRSTMRFLDLDELSVITTDSDQRSFELMFITRSGTRYYANGSLAQLEKALADNRSWLRTSLKYLINLDRIVRSRVNRARDLMIEGFEGWLVNAVSPNSAGGTPYLDQFQKRFITRV